MMAAELCGIPLYRRLFVYLPNVLGKVFVAVPISIGNISLRKALSFLGFSLPYPTSWEYADEMNSDILANHINVWLRGLLIVFVMAFHLVGQGLERKEEAQCASMSFS